MPKLALYDPPMCCSTGVCGPVVDPVLPRVTADLDWLKRQGIQVERYNLAQQPQAFASNPSLPPPSASTATTVCRLSWSTARSSLAGPTRTVPSSPAWRGWTPLPMSKRRKKRPPRAAPRPALWPSAG